MKFEAPSLVMSTERDVVRANRQKLLVARRELDAAKRTLDGLQKANEAMCSHVDQEKRYDPGYAGGGYCGSVCLDCGGDLL